MLCFCSVKINNRIIHCAIPIPLKFWHVESINNTRIQWLANPFQPILNWMLYKGKKFDVQAENFMVVSKCSLFGELMPTTLSKKSGFRGNKRLEKLRNVLKIYMFVWNILQVDWKQVIVMIGCERRKAFFFYQRLSRSESRFLPKRIESIQCGQIVLHRSFSFRVQLVSYCIRYFLCLSFTELISH